MKKISNAYHDQYTYFYNTLLLLLLLLLSLISCTTDVIESDVMEEKACIYGTTQACLCVSGMSGVQSCLENGVGWTPCTCAQESPSPMEMDESILPEDRGDAGPVDEICDDDIDNDLDGTIDESCSCMANETRECYVGSAELAGIGICSLGRQSCVETNAEEGKWQGCEGSVMPMEEVCNGLDDDCDGIVDNGCGCTRGESEPCYEGPDATRDVGQCTSGSRTCNDDGTWSECIGQVLPLSPEEEVCNDLDDDCDGIIDNGCECMPGESEPCYDGPPGTKDIGQCSSGLRTCDGNGRWSECEGQVLPLMTPMYGNYVQQPDGRVELCDAPEWIRLLGSTHEQWRAHDQDCDGEVDTGCPCEFNGPGDASFYELEVGQSCSGQYNTNVNLACPDGNAGTFPPTSCTYTCTAEGLIRSGGVACNLGNGLCGGGYNGSASSDCPPR